MDFVFVNMSLGSLKLGFKTLVNFVLPIVSAILLNAIAGGYLHAQSNEVEVQIRLETGEVTAIDLQAIEGGFIYVNAGAGVKQYGFEQVAQLNFSLSSIELVPFRFDIRLQDESRLLSKAISISKNRMDIETVGGWFTSVPVRQVRWIRLKDYSNEPQLSQQWDNLLADETRSSDMIAINRDGELQAIEGLVGELQNEKIEFTIGERTANVELGKIDAILLYEVSAQESLPTKCRVRLKDGSQLNCHRIALKDQEVEGTTACGLDFNMTRSEISLIDFSVGRDLYLDQLKPTTNDWKPLIASASTIDALRKLNLARINQAYNGQPLYLQFANCEDPAALPEKRHFEHGFAVRGGGKLAFVLNGNMSILSGLVGFDPAADQNGEVLLTIRVDGKIAMEQPLRNRDMKDPFPIDIDISNARRIIFQVDYLDGRSVGDQIHLVDLKVSK